MHCQLYFTMFSTNLLKFSVRKFVAFIFKNMKKFATIYVLLYSSRLYGVSSRNLLTIRKTTLCISVKAQFSAGLGVIAEPGLSFPHFWQSRDEQTVFSLNSGDTYSFRGKIIFQFTTLFCSNENKFEQKNVFRYNNLKN